MCTHCEYMCICVYGCYAALFGDLNFAVTATAATTNAALATTASWLLLLLLLLLVLLPVHPPHPHCVLTSLYPRFYYFQIYHWPSAMKICDTTSPPAPSCVPPWKLGWHGTWTPLFGAKVIHLKRKRKSFISREREKCKLHLWVCTCPLLCPPLDGTVVCPPLDGTGHGIPSSGAGILTM